MLSTQHGGTRPYPRLIKIVLIAVALLALAIVSWAFIRGNGGIDTGTYQLVRLDNGESYIGKLSGLGGAYATMNTPYIYKEPAGGQNADRNNAEIQLLRVSSVSGDLRIATSKIVYWGNLSKEGRVMSAIKNADK